MLLQCEQSVFAGAGIHLICVCVCVRDTVKTGLLFQKSCEISGWHGRKCLAHPQFLSLFSASMLVVVFWRHSFRIFSPEKYHLRPKWQEILS